MNQFEFDYIIAIHGNTALPLLKRCDFTDKQRSTVELASAYFVEVLARKICPHPLAAYRLGNYHEGWAGLQPTYKLIYDYEKYIKLATVGLISNML